MALYPGIKKPSYVDRSYKSCAKKNFRGRGRGNSAHIRRRSRRKLRGDSPGIEIANKAECTKAASPGRRAPWSSPVIAPDRNSKRISRTAPAPPDPAGRRPPALRRLPGSAKRGPRCRPPRARRSNATDLTTRAGAAWPAPPAPAPGTETVAATAGRRGAPPPPPQTRVARQPSSRSPRRRARPSTDEKAPPARRPPPGPASPAPPTPASDAPNVFSFFFCYPATVHPPSDYPLLFETVHVEPVQIIFRPPGAEERHVVSRTRISPTPTRIVHEQPAAATASLNV
jgi:hypothetical protein